MVDRREGDRRDSERREFREQEGRRDPQSAPRRLGLRRYLLPVVLLLLSIVVILGYRIFVVAPRNLASDAADDAWTALEPVMSDLHFPLLAYPSIGAPGPGPLAGDRLRLDDSEELLVRALVARLEGVAARAPGVAEVNMLIATGRLVLGDARKSRLSWESVLAGGDSLQRERALLGLGVLALRTGCRQVSQQDRGFASEHALSYFARLAEDRDAVFLSEALFNQAVTLVVLGRLEAAEAVLARLAQRRGQGPSHALLRHWIDTGATVSLLPPAEGLPTIDPAAKPSPAAEGL